MEAAGRPATPEAMRNWLFHPLIFYPLAALFAVFVIVVSVKPQSWPRAPAPVTAELQNGSLVFAGAAFNSPAVGPEQDITVTRDFWGRAQTLRIAEKAGQAPPGPGQQGAQLLLKPEQAAMLEGRPVTVEVSYNTIPVNMASGLAVSLQGAGPAQWVSQSAPEQAATLRFAVPAQTAVAGVGLRALSDNDDQSYGLEITRVRVTPQP